MENNYKKLNEAVANQVRTRKTNIKLPYFRELYVTRIFGALCLVQPTVINTRTFMGFGKTLFDIYNSL